MIKVNFLDIFFFATKAQLYNIKITKREIELTCHSDVVLGCNSGRPESKNHVLPENKFWSPGRMVHKRKLAKVLPLFHLSI